VKPLPDSVKKLIEGKNFANVATLMGDGSPHVVPTWVDHDGDIILINTFEGSQQHKNAVRDSRIALDVFDPVNHYDRAVIRGRVREVTFDGAEEHLDRMANKYLGVERYEFRKAGIRRVFIKVEPTHVLAPGEGSRWS
jgi:PPOX class probable F420-dependent enzyme